MRSNHKLTSTKASLKSLKVKPTKTRGQNFVVNPEIISAIVNFAEPSANEYIFEIGPGLGALTEQLIKTCPNMSVVEIEKNFCDELKSKFTSVNIFNEDIRTFNFEEFCRPQLELGKTCAVFGNIPYIFSTEIVFHLLSFPKTISRFVLLLQKEFAQRISASPGGKEFGVLSIMTQIHCRTKLGPIIKGDQFFPPTKVQSQAIECVFREKSLVSSDDLPFFRKVVKASFHQRRKKIINSLLSGGFGNKELVERALYLSKIDSGRRAETVNINEYIELAKCLFAGITVL